ncbi:2'-5' RNA ligase family protein [Clostridium sp.]|uniref:2'-5' RNA ligase family protein n=1 Tax=Clostridium sp. TaxID=1506 RepID=UPI001B701FF4|nr:2'-5' RNA ligase family protein [Clostridium sp.]MBP3916180.1 2'-5' RNA ligase family protein [Clostridium sp.]
MYIVEFTFDDYGKKKINDLWELINDNRLNNQFEDKIGMIPHISLAVYEEIEEEFIEKFKRFKKNFKPIPLKFDVLGTFPSSGTCFIKPTVTLELLDFQIKYWEYFKNENTGVREFYKVNSWNPHCSLGIKLNDNDILDIFSLIYKNFVPFSCYLNDIILIKIEELPNGATNTKIIS